MISFCPTWLYDRTRQTNHGIVPFSLRDPTTNYYLNLSALLEHNPRTNFAYCNACWLNILLVSILFISLYGYLFEKVRTNEDSQALCALVGESAVAREARDERLASIMLVVVTGDWYQYRAVYFYRSLQ